MFNFKSRIMEKTKTKCYSPEWCSVSSVKYFLDDETKKNILEAKKLLEENPILSHVAIRGYKLEDSIEQFYYNYDEDEDMPISEDDLERFISDICEILIFKYGSIYFRGWGKYSDDYYEFEIEI